MAVVDSGIDATHPDLSGRVVAINVNRNALTAADGYGHGTHVAGAIAGNDPSGRYLGIAPNATIVSVKVTDDNGVAFESDLLRGLDWVSLNRDAYNIGVINLSVTTGLPSSYQTSPIDAAVEALVHQNVTVVAAAGNLGSAEDAVWYAPETTHLQSPWAVSTTTRPSQRLTIACAQSVATASPRTVWPSRTWSRQAVRSRARGQRPER